MYKQTEHKNDPSRRRILSTLAASVLLGMASIAGADTMMKDSSQKMEGSMESEMSDGQPMQKDGMMHQQTGMEKQDMMDKGEDAMMQEGMQEMPEKGQEMMKQEMKK